MKECSVTEEWFAATRLCDFHAAENTQGIVEFDNKMKSTVKTQKVQKYGSNL